jgi:hypothetical protein
MLCFSLAPTEGVLHIFFARALAAPKGAPLPMVFSIANNMVIKVFLVF